MCSRPSRPSSSPTKTPKLVIFVTLPLTIWPGWYLPGMSVAHGSSASLLQAQGDAAALLVDREHAALDLLALLDHLAGMADLAGPRHVADVQQAVDAFLDLDERAVVGEVADRALDDRCPAGTARPRLSHGFSWVCFMPSEISCFSLLMPQHDDFDLVADVHQLAGMADALGPRHLADVDQAFDALFELDERAVAHDVDDRALDARCRPGTSSLDVLPRAGRLLLEAQGDLLLLAVDVQDLHFDLLVDRDHLATDG